MVNQKRFFIKNIFRLILIIVLFFIFPKLLLPPIWNATIEKKRLLVLFVYDLSDSMNWFFNEKKRKYKIGQELIQMELINHSYSILGLITFGEKNPGLCNNYKTPIKPNFDNYFKIFNYINKARPNGSSPLIFAYFQALTYARLYIGNSKIIIFTDGIGICTEKIEKLDFSINDNLIEVKFYGIKIGKKDKKQIDKFFKEAKFIEITPENFNN